MSNALAWVEFVAPVFVGNAGYVDRVYTETGTNEGITDCVCQSAEMEITGIRFLFKNDEFVTVPYGNIKYSYSSRVQDRNLQGTAQGQGNAPVAAQNIAPEPKRRGRPPKMPVLPEE